MEDGWERGSKGGSRERRTSMRKEERKGVRKKG